jgi:hypothetical protein
VAGAGGAAGAGVFWAKTEPADTASTTAIADKANLFIKILPVPYLRIGATLRRAP